MAHYEVSADGKTVYFVHNGNRYNTKTFGKEKRPKDEMEDIKNRLLELQKEIEILKRKP